MSAHLVFMLGFQSQGGFWNNNASAYMEAALTAASWTQTGRGAVIAEIQRRLPGDTVTHVGEVSPGTPTMGEGGTSFVADTVDPTLAPGDNTPLASNSDGRLKARGTTFLNAFDSELAARIGSHDTVTVYMFHYTHDINDAIGNVEVNQCRGLWLWFNYVRGKLVAAGKPFRMFLVPAGFSDRPPSWSRALIHSAQQHICVNGRRSTTPGMSSLTVIPDLYLAGGAQCMVSFDRARVADNVATAADEAHQSVGSSMRLARMLALQFARWLKPAVAQEYDGLPYVQNAFFDAANQRVRVRVKITPGNRLVWVPRPTEDAANATLEGGGVWPSTNHNNSGPHVLLHAHRIYQPSGYRRARPERIPVTAIAVDNGPNGTGYAFLDLSIGAVVPTRGACVSIQPAAAYHPYWRQGEAIATNLKLLAGLREEAGATPYSNITAACGDVLASPGATTGHTWLAVQSAVNVIVNRYDPGASVFR